MSRATETVPVTLQVDALRSAVALCLEIKKWQLAGPKRPAWLRLTASGGGVSLFATAGDVEVRCALDHQVEIPHEPSLDVLLPAREFARVLKAIRSERVVIDQVDTDTVCVAWAGSDEWNRGLIRWFVPDVGECGSRLDGAFAEPTSLTKISAERLAAAINRTVFATDSEMRRYALGGVLFELAPQFLLVATDGRRAAVSGVMEQAASPPCTIVPAEVCRLVVQAIERCGLRTETSTIMLGRFGRISFNLGEVQIRCSPMEGRFPLWRDTFPRDGFPHAAKFQAGALLEALEPLRAIVTAVCRGTCFSFGGVLEAVHQSPHQGVTGSDKATVSCPLVEPMAEPQSIWLDPRYVVEFLRTLSPETITGTSSCRSRRNLDRGTSTRHFNVRQRKP